jgi:LPXTG-motif cell wall-anchored protein
VKVLLAAVVLASAAPTFHFQDGDIVESSALVVSRRDPDLIYTVNDSGDSARVFVVDVRSGETVGVTNLAGVENVDFEALAFAPGRRLLVGDIGDNDAERDSVHVHVIDEPHRGQATVTPETVELVYGDGPRDAEAVFVLDGRIFLVSKEPVRSTVFRGPDVTTPPDWAELRPVGDAPGLTTDATVMDDGRVLLRNYTHAFVMTRAWDIAQSIKLPESELGESLAAPPTGDDVYAGSEGERSPVYRVTLPPYPAASPGLLTTPPEATPVEHESVGREGTHWGPWLTWLGLGLLVVGLTALLVRSRRRAS